MLAFELVEDEKNVMGEFGELIPRWCGVLMRRRQNALARLVYLR